MFRKIQFFAAVMLVASAVAAISGNISCKETRSGNFLQQQNAENLLYCDFEFDINELHL